MVHLPLVVRCFFNNHQLLTCGFVPQLPSSDCSLLLKITIASKRIVTPNGTIPGAVEIKQGRIVSIVAEEYWHVNTWFTTVVNYGEAVVIPGFIDVEDRTLSIWHAHLDDPGRTKWEGFPSGTKAAAAEEEDDGQEEEDCLMIEEDDGQEEEEDGLMINYLFGKSNYVVCEYVRTI